MKVLLVSEGKHESGPDGQDGALAQISQKLMNQTLEITFEKVSDRKVNEIQPIHGKSAAYEKRIMLWLKYAAKNNFDALILVIDQDGQSDRQVGIENAQQNQFFNVPRTLGLAIRTFDAWMLADETAWSKLSQVKAKRPKSPESLRDPKKECERLRKKLAINAGMAEVYASIAEHADPSRIAKRCPNGFAPFKTRVESLIQDYHAARK